MLNCFFLIVLRRILICLLFLDTCSIICLHQIKFSPTPFSNTFNHVLPYAHMTLILSRLTHSLTHSLSHSLMHSTNAMLNACGAEVNKRMNVLIFIISQPWFRTSSWYTFSQKNKICSSYKGWGFRLKWPSSTMWVGHRLKYHHQRCLNPILSNLALCVACWTHLLTFFWLGC